MGFADLFSRKQKTKSTMIGCCIIGEDKTLQRQLKLEATGLYLIQNTNLLGYDTFTDTIGSYTVATENGKPDFRGPTALLYEPMARPFSFKDMEWKQDTHKKDVLLESARREGEARAVQQLQDSDRFDRISTVLLLLSALFGILVLLYVFQSGILSKLIGG